MAILVANIGTSDLAIKIENYYIPISFDRNEPNLELSDLDEEEKIIWSKDWRDSDIQQKLCPELGIKKYSFRELTKIIWDKYQEDEANWHKRISPGRIWGVIQTAREKFQLDKVYVWVTDQPENIIEPITGENKFNKGFLTDTVNLFEILKKWVSTEFEGLELAPIVIPRNTLPIDQDKLLNLYYDFFANKLNEQSPILVSVKGGTPQMQTALRMQGFSASTNKILLIDPQLSLKKLLNGQPSECKFTSYWRYTRNQKFNEVKNLLEKRWDFSGAIAILEEWQESLKFSLKYTGNTDLQADQELISRMIKTLQIADYCFNLDVESAINVWYKNGSSNHQLKEKLNLKVVQQVERYSSLLNVYTQCRIYEQLGQTANFLTCLSSFYEGVLFKIAKNFNGRQEFEAKVDRGGGNYTHKNRYDKIEFVDNLIKKQGNKQEKEAWSKVLGILESLDFWCRQRNNLIHKSQGVSSEIMNKMYQKEVSKGNSVCYPQDIIDNLTFILESQLNLVDDNYHKFVGKDAKYYIYSAVCDWVSKEFTSS